MGVGAMLGPLLGGLTYTHSGVIPYAIGALSFALATLIPRRS